MSAKLVPTLADRGCRVVSATDFHMRHYATKRKVAGSIPDEVMELFNYYDPGADSASNRNEYQESSWG
jgi:hypothetical protein